MGIEDEKDRKPEEAEEDGGETVVIKPTLRQLAEIEAEDEEADGGLSLQEATFLAGFFRISLKDAFKIKDPGQSD